MARVTIAVPVFNGGEMLRESLQGLLSQACDDVEIIIGDNASTDQTPEICAGFAARDPRIRVIRRPDNLGALGNFRDLIDQASAPLFLWRSYDDLSDPAYIVTLAQALDTAPGADLAAPHVETLRMATGKRRPRPVAGLIHGQTPAHRVLRASQAGWIYGLWRTEAVRSAFDWAVPAIHPHVWGWDHLAMFPAILSGRVTFANEARLQLRLNHAIAKEKLPDQRARQADLAARYKAACFALIDDAGLGTIARLRMRWAVLRHMNRRVTPLLKRV